MNENKNQVQSTLKDIYYALIATCLFFSRHFLLTGQQRNAFYYGQTLQDFVFVCVYFFLVVLIISIVFSAVRKFFPKQYKKIIFTTLYISIFPLLDFIFISVSHRTYRPDLSWWIYPFVTFIYSPVIILISFKYQIEKYGDRIIKILPFICIVIIYHMIPQSFSKNVVENEFIAPSKPSIPIHLIIFDGTSYDVLNDQDLKHLFPNLNGLFANDSFVFEDAHSPGIHTVLSVPALLTGIEYDRFREENLQFLIAQSEDEDYEKLPIEGSLFQISKSNRYNNVLIGTYFPYGNIFGKYLTYGRVFPFYPKFSQLLPSPFAHLLYISHFHQRNIFLDAFNQYLSKIDSSPRNTFFFIHFPIPHEPFVFDSQGFVDQYWEVMLKGGRYKYKERYVNQLMFVDKKVGEIVKKLKDNNLYDKSLIIITSDHNYFKVKEYNSHYLMYINMYNMTKVPLFIKVPFQKSQHLIKEKVYTVNVKKFLSSFFESGVVDIKELK